MSRPCLSPYTELSNSAVAARGHQASNPMSRDYWQPPPEEAGGSTQTRGDSPPVQDRDGSPVPQHPHWSMRTLGTLPRHKAAHGLWGQWLCQTHLLVSDRSHQYSAFLKNKVMYQGVTARTAELRSSCQKAEACYQLLKNTLRLPCSAEHDKMCCQQWFGGGRRAF